MYILEPATHVALFEAIQEFNCNNDSMSNYLKQSAYCNHIEFEENTTVVLKNGDIVGYFTLKMDMIELPEHSFKALELARLAVDRRYQNKGIGVIIASYIEEVAKQSNNRFITVDALSEYKEWYMNRGFFILSEEDIITESPVIYMYKDLYDEALVDDYYDQ
ncbi:GNAT family N-acetyltransferase [Bacillus wiedmannii]|uniref:GNAT family N-acetyltransferase n=1 Tax=Bacillus wiedmannii TaxID=1890302 RepID=UPI003D19978D